MLRLGYLNDVAKALFSNRVEVLVGTLQKNLRVGAALKQRWLIVPSQAMKRYVMAQMVEEGGVVFGLQYPFLDEAMTKLCGVGLPSKRLLGLQLEKEIRLGRDREFDQTLSLLGVTGSDTYGERTLIAEFADKLAEHFLRYAKCGWQLCARKTGFQAQLFRQSFVGPLPWEKKIASDVEIHLFCPSFIEKVYLDFFAQCNTTLYCLTSSPYFDEEAHWGKVERRFALSIEEAGYETARAFVSAWPSDHSDVFTVEEPPTLLNWVQAIDRGAPPADDGSIQVVECVSKRHEVEHLFEQVVKSGLQPKDILVMAPKITEYIPYLEAVFTTVPLQFLDTTLQRCNLHLRGLLDLLELVESRLDLDDLKLLLSNPAILAKQRWSAREGAQIIRWLADYGLRWGLHAADRARWHKAAYNTEFVEQELGTWEETLQRFLEAETNRTDFTQRCALEQYQLFDQALAFLHRLKDDFAFMRSPQEKSITQWNSWLKELQGRYFEEVYDSGLTGELLVSFSSMVHRIKEMLKREGEQPPQMAQMNAIVCCSLLPLRAVPAKHVYLLGMSLEKFPRVQTQSALDLLANEPGADFCPTLGDLDRLLFLETLLSARERWTASYVCLPEDPAPSLLVTQLLEQVGLNVVRRPESYLLIEEPIKRAQAKEEKREEKLIMLRDMERMLSDPLRHYFEKGLGIRLQWPDMEARVQFSGSDLDRIEQRAVLENPEAILADLQRTGQIPPEPLGSVVREEIRKRFARIDKGFDKWKIRREELTLVARMDGTIRGIDPQGRIVIAHESQRLKSLPYAAALGTSLIPLRNKEALEALPFEELVALYKRAMQVPLPFHCSNDPYEVPFGSSNPYRERFAALRIPYPADETAYWQERLS